MPTSQAIEKTSIPRVRMKDISKSFLDVRANHEVSIEVYPGETVALLGENGAGKTTLMNILFGLYKPDAGSIEIDGQAMQFRSPSQAIKAGIGMVHQHFTLVPALTVLENLMLGPHGGSGFFPRRNACSRKAREIMERFGLSVDLETLAGSLPVGQQQKVEIIKALYRGARCLIMDEPTAVLTPGESEDLFATLENLKKDGLAIVLISHKMKEIMRSTDRIYILRQGMLAAEKPTASTSPKELATLMVGPGSPNLPHSVPESPQAGQGTASLADSTDPSPGATTAAQAAAGTEVVLRVEGVSVRRENGIAAVEELSFDVRKGEIFGLAGVSGNGQTELCDVLFGLRGKDEGTVQIGTRLMENLDPHSIMAAGVARIPEDRMSTGLMLDLSVEENLFLKNHRHRGFRRAGHFLDHPRIGHFAQTLIKDFHIKTDGRSAVARSLSGGNLQKVILARELQDGPPLIIASQPTRGLDVNASAFIHQRLRDEKARGAGILLVSDDLDEILELADRVGVLYEGRLMGVQEKPDINRDRLGLWMGGAQE